MKEPDIIFETYRLHVEMIDRISQRRGNANRFFISVISGILTVIAFSVNMKVSVDRGVVFISFGILGILLLILWLSTINAYKKLNSVKFEVLYELEQQIPFQFYMKEWSILKSEKKYITLTKLEKLIPILLMIPFLILLMYGIFSIN